ncbi:glycoside hydrolase family protein [Sorangium cellulosum]|uniref:glycoside hydrolase family protein n=1 Tax=Sorangium cellulosum TaxID=56 RepID=UPI00041B8915|nr:glycoside hydrolase family protein [Sorangium cellulosum]
MRRDPKTLLCGISPLLGILLSVACVGESFHQDANGDGGAGNVPAATGAGDGGAGLVGPGSTGSAAGHGAGAGDSAGDGGGDGDGGGAGDGGGDGDGGNAGAGGGEGAAGRPCKRGIGYGYHSVADLSALSASVGWWYNWATVPDEALRGGAYVDLGVDFVPMVWGGRFDADQVKAAIPSGAKYLLAFNEPNFFAQANLSAAEAAALWPDLEEIADEKGLKLVSPAVNFCGGGCHETDPFAYLDAFFAACEGCRVDFIAAHWYACDRPALEWYLGELKRYRRPIWLTEFSCGDGADRSPEAQAAYMREAVPLLESDPDVFRYAWFSGRTDAIPNVDLLGASGELTALGELYVSLPHAERCSQ